jgi:GNAT superfamily N-acetyltransferase
MDYVIRMATVDDTPGIAAVAVSAWPEEPLDAAAIAALMAEPGRATHVAVQGRTVVGFVDGFVTRASDGAARWEVDLLAVAPQSQGRGVGRGLVAASVAAGGDALGAVRARALIRVENIGSERAFAACGFSPEPFASALWVADGLAVVGEPDGLHIVPVRTFRYAGTWLENVTAHGICALHPATDGGMVGAVIPLADRETSRAAADAGLRNEGTFRFWHRAMEMAR